MLIQYLCKMATLAYLLFYKLRLVLSEDSTDDVEKSYICDVSAMLTIFIFTADKSSQ